MKILNEYSNQHIKKNKRHTVSVLVAITIASALLCALCIFIDSYWQAQVDSAIEKIGYWHGELWDAVSGDKLKGILENPQVDCVMTKGDWFAAQLADTKRPFFLMRDGDENFWRDSNLKNTVLAGRLPRRKGEIVVSALFLTENTNYKIGDSFSVPVGERMLGDKELPTQAYRQEGESFLQTGTENYTIVGSLDVSGVSAYPGYIAMGWYSIAEVRPDDELTIYVRLRHPRRVYEIMPEIAGSAGLQKDDRGQYAIRYHTPLLGLYGIQEKGEPNIQFLLLAAMAVILVVLVMATFILIIYNAFSLSANSRSRELSILKSIGATPKQIKNAVLYEGVLLWAVQMPFSLLIGYGFSEIVFSRVNDILQATENYRDMQVSFSWIVIILSLALSLVTVLLSARIPAKKMSKLPAVEGIQQSGTKIKRDKKKLLDLFGIEGALAAKQASANRKSLRIAVISLSLCLILISSYLVIISVYNIAQSKNEEIVNYDMNISLNMLDEPNGEMIEQITSQPEVQDSVLYRKTRMTTVVPANRESKEFAELGGFDSVSFQYNVAKVSGDYRIVVNLVGMKDDSFENYCEAIGVDPQDFYDVSEFTGILLDATYHVAENAKEVYRIPMTDIKSGEGINLAEKIFEDDGDYTVDVKIGAVTDKIPGGLSSSKYSAAFILPMEKYQAIASNFIEDGRDMESNRMILDLKVGDEKNPLAKEKFTGICNSYLGSEDFEIWSLREDREAEALRQRAISIAVFAVAMMIGIIGIINAFSTISNNLQIHKRAYALLRCVGLTPKGLNKVLFFEGLSFVLKPLMIGIPCVLLVCAFMLNFTLTTWGEFAAVFQGTAILIYIAGVFAAILCAYWISSRSIKQGNIMDAVKNELL